jgi:mRNA-degrading endonuclease HigB of HigAB toxin-antitoxin module
MFVSGKNIVEKYLDKHSILRSSYLKWLLMVEASTVNSHNELKLLFLKANYVGNERYAFDLKGK